MAEDFWEQAVETYLTIDQGLFINPQYVIGKPGEWEGRADFLALEFPDKTAWMIEVTRSPGPKLKSKIGQFSTEYKPRITDQLERHFILPKDSDWKIGLWIFAPKASEKSLQSWMTQTNELHRFTSLEETTFPDWDSRWRY